uniref:Interleukin-6 receptor subunit beta-like n=1 Tax=Labrus bergylta TaxID=56723 RepID=A0A3Q3F6F0_9LABR|nr:interleukin-6 receptor subunit beta-like [Labrus bergylta]
MHLLLAPFIILVGISSICKGEHESRCNVVPTDPYIEVGSDIKIVCHTCVNEKIYWTLQNREIDETLSNIINSSYTVLSLRNFTEHSATVVCHEKATGDIIGGTTIKTYSKPSKISCILDYDNQNASGVPELLTCNWEHQINPSKEIYYTVLSSSWLHPSQSEICNSQITTCTSKYKNISDKISMFGSFNVTVRANSSVFEAYSETQEFTFNQIWKIVRPKLDVTTRPGGVLVKWTQMYSSVECHCQVKYNKVVNVRTPEWLIDTTLYGEERGNITVKNLESCSTYTFSVRCALDKAPWSDWSLEKRVLTKLNMTDVKLRLWRNIAEPEKHGLRKVHAMWTGIPSTCQDTFTYRIKLIPSKQNITGVNYTETLCGNSSYDVDVNQNAHRIILTVSHNDAVFSEDSVYVPAARESLPQVTDVQTTTLEGVIEISWKAPGQPVSGYMIDYTHNGNQFYWKESTNTNVTLTDLLDKTPYNITVTPLFDGKTGHGTQALQICSRVGDTGNVTIIDVQAYDKSAFVSWDVKSQEACSGVVVRYTVFYNTQKGPQLNVSVDRTKQFILLKDLTPDTQYHVYIQATALTGTTQSSEWLFMTKRFDPRLTTALLVCGSIAVLLVLSLGLCCAVQWKKFKEKPVPNPGFSSVALWSPENHQEGTCPVERVNKPHESPFDIVYPEELEGMTTPSLPTGCKSNIVRDQTEEYTVPDVVPAPDLQNKDPRESEDMLHPSSPEESTALLLSERNQSSPYRSQSSKEAPAQRTSKQSKRAALEQEDKTTSATVYVTLEMFEQDNGQSTETVT